jgi:hypothetical protein
MATVVNKDFKIKSGLVVEGTTGKINNFDILTKKQADQDYIVDLIGGTATPDNTPNTVVKRDGSGNFAAGTITADLTGDVTGTVSDISNHNTDDLTEGTSNQYFTSTRAKDAVAAALGNGIEYEAGNFDVQVGDGITIGGGTGNQVVVDRNEVDTWYDASGAAAQALVDAKDYTDDREVAITSAYQTYADQAEADAVSSANSYTNTALEDYTPTSGLDAAIDGYGYLKSADLTGYATETYVNTAVANIVDGAPELLNTLNELAAAIGDDENYATTVANLVAEKQNNLTAGSNIDITNDVISVVGLASTDISDFATAAQAAGTGYFDPIGSADTAEDNANIYADGVALTAENNAKAYADGLAVNYDAYGSAATAEANANTYTDNAISGLDTDDIEEGVTNQYYTEERAKTDAAELLTSATLTNITITGNGSGLTITAENGVADSDTDDLAEGTNNLYFTDQRAVDALQAVVPNFEAVEIDSVAKQVAATLEAATAGVQTAYTWSSNDYRTAEFLVKTANGTHTEISKVLLTLDTSDNIAITEYGIVGTNGSLATVSAGMAGSDVQLLVTTANNTSTVTVVGTLLA